MISRPSTTSTTSSPFFQPSPRRAHFTSFNLGRGCGVHLFAENHVRRRAHLHSFTVTSPGGDEMRRKLGKARPWNMEDVGIFHFISTSLVSLKKGASCHISSHLISDPKTSPSEPDKIQDLAASPRFDLGRASTPYTQRNHRQARFRSTIISASSPSSDHIQ